MGSRRCFRELDGSPTRAKRFDARRLWVVATALVGSSLATGAQAALVSSVQVLPPLTGEAPDLNLVASNVSAAIDAWGRWLEPAAGASLDVIVQFGAVSTATGRSVASSFARRQGAFNVFDQGAMGEIRTGVDPNGADVDAEIILGRDYSINDMWFDPSPASRSLPVPAGRVDAVSVFIHEVGHALAFNGWRDPLTGGLPGDFMSAFDAHVAPLGGALGFFGPEAMQAFGGPVPLTPGALSHLGGFFDARFSDEIMNGSSIARGRRYSLSNLDLAILRDIGAPVRAGTIPAPGALAGLAIGVALTASRRRRTALQIM